MTRFSPEPSDPGCFDSTVRPGRRDLHSAQRPTRTRSRQVKSFKCSFPVYTVGAWKTGVPQAQIKQADQFTLTIDEIDTDSGSGRVTGTAGPVEVTALLTVSSLHFMERSVTGTLNITTIFVSDGGVEDVPGRALPARLPADEHPWIHVRAHGHAELRHVPGPWR